MGAIPHLLQLTRALPILSFPQDKIHYTVTTAKCKMKCFLRMMMTIWHTKPGNTTLRIGSQNWRRHFGEKGNFGWSVFWYYCIWRTQAGVRGYPLPFLVHFLFLRILVRNYGRISSFNMSKKKKFQYGTNPDWFFKGLVSSQSLLCVAPESWWM